MNRPASAGNCSFIIAGRRSLEGRLCSCKSEKPDQKQARGLYLFFDIVGSNIGKIERHRSASAGRKTYHNYIDTNQYRLPLPDNRRDSKHDEFIVCGLRLPRGGRCKSYKRKQDKGARWMPRHRQAMKDVTSCEKLRGAANKLGSAGIRMGKPTPGSRDTPYGRANGGN